MAFPRFPSPRSGGARSGGSEFRDWGEWDWGDGGGCMKRLEAFPTQNPWRGFLHKTPGGVFYLKHLEVFPTDVFYWKHLEVFPTDVFYWKHLEVFPTGVFYFLLPWGGKGVRVPARSRRDGRVAECDGLLSR